MMLWLLFLTLPCLGDSVPVTSDPSPGTELVGILGGHDAPAGKWPWQVGLWYFDLNFQWRLICGGSLIHPQWVLTAAHCVGRKNLAPWHFQVQVGQVRLSNLGYVQVAEVIIHPDYNFAEGALGGADVALLRLTHRVTRSDRVDWIALPSESLTVPPGTMCWVTGWGDTGAEESPQHLQELEVPIVADDTCKQQYSRINHLIKEDMLCAGSKGQGFCRGDSGGPLVCKWMGTWFQVGVVSWGERPCSDINLPGVYARVTYFLSWIHHYIDSSPEPRAGTRMLLHGTKTGPSAVHSSFPDASSSLQGASSSTPLL